MEQDGIYDLENALNSPIKTITDYPSQLSSGGLHDYYSNGTYWHPNPNTENHLPYVRRDGIINKENFIAHKNLILQLSVTSALLYREFKRSNKMKCIKRLDDNLYRFFVCKETMINPSLNYSQAIPGICTGRNIGLIDTLQLIDIPLLILDAEMENLISPITIEGLRSWFSLYTEWLLSSSFGKAESEEKNNHSIAYYAQLASFSLLSNRRKEIRKLISNTFKESLVYQMDCRGFFPLELARTRPFSYSIFALDCLATVATLASSEDDNLWLYDGIMKKAIDAMLPYMMNKNQWPFGIDIEGWEQMPSKSTFLYFASKAFRNDRYEEIWKSIKAPSNNPDEIRHIPIRIPEIYPIIC